uniref:Uncharacterized protein n=1 Tax=Amphimedon queenslandica TaxID=400682 RepID=A0A1X7TEI0_AMPQE
MDVFDVTSESSEPDLFDLTVQGDTDDDSCLSNSQPPSSPHPDLCDVSPIKGLSSRYCDEESLDQPIYEIPPPKYSADTILSILLNLNINESKVCSGCPLRVTSSATFVVDLSKLAHPDDVKIDSFGIWNYSGSHPMCFRVHIKELGYVSVEKCAPGAKGDNVEKAS